MAENEVLYLIEIDQGDGWTRVRRMTGEYEEGFVPTSYIETNLNNTWKELTFRSKLVWLYEHLRCQFAHFKALFKRWTRKLKTRTRYYFRRMFYYFWYWYLLFLYRLHFFYVSLCVLRTLKSSARCGS